MTRRLVERILRDREPAMLELAKFLVLDKSSVTGLISRAERRGLVKRSASPLDQRSVTVTATAKGRELAQTFAKYLDPELAQLIAGLSEADQKRFSALAARIVSADAQQRLAA